MPVDTPTKIRENRLRRMALRRGMMLRKSGRRDPNALDYGLFSLVDINTNRLINEPLPGLHAHALTLDEVEDYLTPD
jgi:hypothetical protein